MTSGKKRQLQPFLTKDELLELETIDAHWAECEKNPFTSLQNRYLTQVIGERFTEIYAGAERRRKIAKID